MAGFKDAALEAAVLAALHEHPTFQIAGDDRTIAADFAQHLRAAGLHPRVEDASLYVSMPRRADLEIDGARFPCDPACFSRSTAPDAVSGALVVTNGDEERTLTGSIAAVDGSPDPETVYRIERRGAVAQIYVARDDDRREVSCSTLQGAPTHETYSRRPRTAVAIVPRSTRERLLRGSAASLLTSVDEEWSSYAIPVADIHGTHDPDEFVLVHGGDASALLAMARALHTCRAELRRSVRIAWWPARAASAHGAAAWYADAHAAEIDEWCLAHVCVEDLHDAADDTVTWMSEGVELCLESIAAVGAGAVTGRRPGPGAGSPFNQIGVTAMFGGRRFDRDLQAYATAVTRLVTSPLYPLDFTAPVLEMGAAVQRYQAIAGNELDLRGVSQDLGSLRRAISAWRSDADTAMARHAGDQEPRRRANATLRRLARTLVPLGYVRGERFDHDPAVRFSALPRLEAALHVATVPPERRAFVRIALLREQNKVRAAIREARRLVT